MDALTGEIRLLAVGDVTPNLLEQLCAAITETFARPCHIGEPLTKPKYAFDAKRGQYSAEAILRRLHTNGAERVLLSFE